MHGLAVLQHDVVGDVHQVVDGAHTGVADPLPHPGRRRGDLHVLHHPGGVAGAEGRIFDGDLRHVRDIAAGLGLHHRLMELQLLAEGDRHFPRQTDHAQAVRPVGGDLILHHMVVPAQELCHIVAGLAVLVEDQDAVLDAVGEFLLLGVEVCQGTDGVLFGVVGHQIAFVDVLAGGHGLIAGGERAFPQVHAGVFNLGNLCRHHLAEDPVSALDEGRDGGLQRVDGMIVIQQRRGLDLPIGEIVDVGVQLLEGAEHTIGLHAPKLALLDLHTGGQKGLVQRRRDQVPHVHIPGAGADLDRFSLAHVDLGHQHMIGVGVLLQRQDTPHFHIMNGLGQVLGDLHLGAGDAHGLGKGLVPHLLQRQLHKLIQPFSRHFHINNPPF